jgi:hypothetical protein
MPGVTLFWLCPGGSMHAAMIPINVDDVNIYHLPEGQVVNALLGAGSEWLFRLPAAVL